VINVLGERLRDSYAEIKNRKYNSHRTGKSENEQLYEEFYREE